MSNELAVLDGGLPSYLKDLNLDDTTKALMGGGGGGESKRISIKGGVWRMMVNGKEVAQNEDRTMNVVIAAASPKVSRTFYMKQYSEGGDVVAPDCWSSDGEVPDSKAKNPQSKRCIDCPQNEKGSGQGDSRACRFSQRLAVVLANDVRGDLYQLTLPATSIFGSGEPGKWPLQTYAKMLGGKGVPVTAVVTEMKFDTNSATPKITFRPVRVLEPNEHEAVIEQGKSVAAQRAITMTVAEMDGAKVEAPVAPKLEAKKTVEKIEVEEVVEEAAPTKRSSKKEETPAEKKDLSKILDEWDDE
jgi:hypothetical protein